MKDSALATAGFILAFIALIHLLRIYFKFSIVIGSTAIPIWANVIGLIVFAALSFWMFYALKIND